MKTNSVLLPVSAFLCGIFIGTAIAALAGVSAPPTAAAGCEPFAKWQRCIGGLAWDTQVECPAGVGKEILTMEVCGSEHWIRLATIERYEVQKQVK